MKKFHMLALLAMLLLGLVLLVSCGDDDDDDADDDTDDDVDDDTSDDDTGDDDTGDDDTGDDDTGDDDTGDDDTGDDDTGDDDTDDDDDTVSGNMMEINGGIYSADTAEVYYPFALIKDDPTISWVQNPQSADASYLVNIKSEAQIQFSGWRETDGHFWANDFPSPVPIDCGALSVVGGWTTITVAFDYTAQTTDVLFNGSPSANCTGLGMTNDTGILQINFVEPIALGSGGITDIDNLEATNGGSPAWDIDFNSYSPGPLPAPWVYVIQHTSTITVVTP